MVFPLRRNINKTDTPIRGGRGKERGGKDESLDAGDQRAVGRKCTGSQAHGRSNINSARLQLHIKLSVLKASSAAMARSANSSTDTHVDMIS